MPRVPPAIPRSFCPTAQFDAYARWHAEILSGNFSSLQKYKMAEHRVPQFIIYTCRPHVEGQQDPCGGLADRIVGIVTTVMFGMLSNRVALVDFQRGVKAHDVFSPVSLDWTVDIDQWVAKHGVNATGNYTTLELNYHTPSKWGLHGLLNSKWDDWWHDAVVRLEINRGLTYGMFNHSVYGPRLKEWGWTPETSFACLLDYILTPAPQIAERVNAAIAPLLDPAHLVVGLQIRAGDIAAFSPLEDKTTVADHYPMFLCAERLGERWGFGRPLRIFVVSDSLALKKDAAAKYGSTLVTTPTVPAHVSISNKLEAYKETMFGPHRKNATIQEALAKLNGSMNATAELEAYEGAIMDMWTLSYAPYLAISQRSGFGNIAAFRAYWRNPVAVVRRDPDFTGDGCGTPAGAKTYEDLAMHWSMGRKRAAEEWESMWD
ncbi:hypothetical protein DFJ74DRAFT_676332 [Hyaloraphidium curvatum]|nr:hypothetical protein DFJ74DRAFT_676332 [Hyaloraphidium curvatum]